MLHKNRKKAGIISIHEGWIKLCFSGLFFYFLFFFKEKRLCFGIYAEVHKVSKECWGARFQKLSRLLAAGIT